MGEEEKTYPSPSFLATSQYTQTLHTPLRRTGPPRQGPRQASGLDLGREQRKQRLWFGKQELEPAFLFQDYCWRAAGINKGGGHGGGGGGLGGDLRLAAHPTRAFATAAAAEDADGKVGVSSPPLEHGLWEGRAVSRA